jgi:hypothetical protein
MSVQEQLQMAQAIKDAEASLRQEFLLSVAALHKRIDDQDAEIGRVKELVATLAINAPEKIDPIRVPLKPKILREMFPDDPGPSDAAA